MYNQSREPNQYLPWHKLLVVRILTFLVRAIGKIIYEIQNRNWLIPNEGIDSNRENNILALSSLVRDRSILVTTFEKRQFSSALPLIRSIRDLGIDIPISVFINGNLNQNHNAQDRSRFIHLLSELSDVNVVTSRVMTGISRNWNLGIQLLGTESVLCLSDDLEISTGFKEDLEAAFAFAEKEDFIVIGSFASFIINSRCLERVGWFDERFMGFGEEDGDYMHRFIEAYGREPRNYFSSAIRHLNLQTRGDESPGVTKYSLFNLAFRKIKYVHSETGILGMFGSPQKAKLPRVDFHPMESFRRKNKHLFREKDLNIVIAEIEIQ